MATIDKINYVTRRVSKGYNSNIFFVKYFKNSDRGYIPFNYIYLDKSFIGKKIRLKVEIVEESTNKNILQFI